MAIISWFRRNRQCLQLNRFELFRWLYKFQLENGAYEKQRKRRQGGRAGDGGGGQSRGLGQQFRDWHFGEVLLQVIRAKCEHKRAQMERGYFA